MLLNIYYYKIICILILMYPIITYRFFSLKICYFLHNNHLLPFQDI